jgi:diguanylate cyclase (GGDEF)-like protein
VVAGDARGTAVRLGGEEFGLLLPNQDLIKAYAVGERVCQTIRSTMIPHRHSAVAEYITVSLGVATMYPAPATDSRVLLINADTALYRAKSLGRDRVIAYVEAAADPAAANITIIAR